MIIICGQTIAEVERDLEMAKRAIATGAPMGIGGATMADVEKAMAMLKGEVGATAPITNPNYVAPKPCCCGCNCECEDEEDEWDCEDEEEDDVDCCPACGAGPDDYDVMCDTCDACGYGYEDEEEEEDTDEYVEDLIASAERLGIPMDAIHAWIDTWLK